MIYKTTNTLTVKLWFKTNIHRLIGSILKKQGSMNGDKIRTSLRAYSSTLWKLARVATN